jgi:hypothetical protein
VAEAAASPEDGELLREQLRATLLFRAQADASAAGDEALVQILGGLMKTMCSEHVVKMTSASALIHSGLQQGCPPRTTTS